MLMMATLARTIVVTVLSLVGLPSKALDSAASVNEPELLMSSGSKSRQTTPGFKPWPKFDGCQGVYGNHSPDWLDSRLLMRAGWPQETWHSVCRIMSCESNFRPEAKNGPMLGLMQIWGTSRPWSVSLAKHGWTSSDLFDPLINLKVAYEGYLAIGSSFAPPSGWACAWAAK